MINRLNHALTVSDGVTAARLRLTLSVLTHAGESSPKLRNDEAWLKLVANTTLALNRIEGTDPRKAMELVRLLETQSK